MADTSPSLLARLRDGNDRRGWQEFFERYWRLIYSFGRRCGLSASDAEDIVQEVVTEVFQAMPRFEYSRSKGTFRGYLQTITQRNVTDHLRRQARRPTAASRPGSHGNGALMIDPGAREAEQVWERDWRRNLLQACLRRVALEIEPRSMQAFQLYALDGWSAEETAEFLNLSVPAVYMAKSRVAKRVRDHYERELNEETTP